MTIKLTESERQVFAALADVLIPEAEGMPSASQIGIHAGPLNRVLELRPELGQDLQRGLTAAAGVDPAQAAKILNRQDPDALGAIGLIASAAYYMQPRVHELLNYPGQVSRPARPKEENDYERGGMLQAVIDRGRIYRQTSD
jgi:hypothetical protein